MSKDISRKGAEARRGRGDTHRSILIDALGGMLVDAMERLLGLPDDYREHSELAQSIKTVDGHEWRLKLEYFGYSGPDDLCGFAPLREEDGLTPSREDTKAERDEA